MARFMEEDTKMKSLKQTSYCQCEEKNSTYIFMYKSSLFSNKCKNSISIFLTQKLLSKSHLIFLFTWTDCPLIESKIAESFLFHKYSCCIDTATVRNAQFSKFLWPSGTPGDGLQLRCHHNKFFSFPQKH